MFSRGTRYTKEKPINCVLFLTQIHQRKQPKQPRLKQVTGLRVVTERANALFSFLTQMLLHQDRQKNLSGTEEVRVFNNEQVHVSL